MDLKTFVYLLNAVFIIVHEIDSAYWKEWELFNLPIGLDGFLLLHLPLVSIMMYGLLEVSLGSWVGNILYIILALGGFFAFGIHTYFLRKGDERFRTTVSQGLIYIILLLSLIQLLFL
jgi:hypothetical protein